MIFNQKIRDRISLNHNQYQVRMAYLIYKTHLQILIVILKDRVSST